MSKPQPLGIPFTESAIEGTAPCADLARRPPATARREPLGNPYDETAIERTIPDALTGSAKPPTKP